MVNNRRAAPEELPTQRYQKNLRACLLLNQNPGLLPKKIELELREITDQSLNPSRNQINQSYTNFNRKVIARKLISSLLVS